MAVMCMLPLGAINFFHVSSDMLAIFWIILSFGSVAANVMLRAIVTESFPTSQRSTAAGWMTLTGTVGAALGLWSISWGQSMGYSLPTVESIVSCFAIIAGLALFLLPETRGLELEEISDDPHAAPQASRPATSGSENPA
jgi:MFS family permease